MRKTLIILLIFLGILISQDTTNYDKPSQKSVITSVITDNQISAPNNVVSLNHSTFYSNRYPTRVVIKILCICIVILGLVFIRVLVKVAKDLIS